MAEDDIPASPLGHILEVAPREILVSIVRDFGGVRDPSIIVRSSLAKRIIAIDSVEVRMILIRWASTDPRPSVQQAARHLMPDAREL